MTSGLVHRLMPCTSTIHMIVAIATQAMPAVKTTYELVQILLLIGNDQFHMRPATMPSAPTANRLVSRSSSGRLVPSHWPARLPSIVVAIAGMVEKRPSGSQVTLFTQVWLPRPKRDQSRRKRSHQAAIVRDASPSTSWPIAPESGTGSTVMANQ